MNRERQISFAGVVLLAAGLGCRPITADGESLLDDGDLCVSDSACRSWVCVQGRCAPGWPSGALGDVHVAAGDTWMAPAGSVLDFASLTIDEGGQLVIRPAETMRWTFIGVRDQLKLAGRIIATGDPSLGGTVESPRRVEATAPGTGEHLEHLLLQRDGGDGGDGGNACLSSMCSTTVAVSGGRGGHGAFGGGGGGGAGGYWAGSLVINGRGKEGDDATVGAGGQGGATVLTDGALGGPPGKAGAAANGERFLTLDLGAPGEGGGGGGRGLHGLPLFVRARTVSISGSGGIDVRGLAGGPGGAGGIGGYRGGMKTAEGPASGNGGGGGGGAGGSGGALVIRTMTPAGDLRGPNALRFDGGPPGEQGVQPLANEQGALPLVHSGAASTRRAEPGYSGPAPDIREP